MWKRETYVPEELLPYLRVVDKKHLPDHVHHATFYSVRPPYIIYLIVHDKERSVDLFMWEHEIILNRSSTGLSTIDWEDIDWNGFCIKVFGQ